MRTIERVKPVGRALNKGMKTILLVLLIFFPGSPATSAAQEVDTPVEVHIPIFFKILGFDRNLKKRVKEEIVLGIVFQEKYRKSLNVKKQVENYLEKFAANNIEEIPLRWVPVALDELSRFKITLAKEKVNVIYIAPLRAVDIKELVLICRSSHITSLTGVTEYCEAGVAVSVGSKGGNPMIIINQAAVQSEGLDFSSQLLKLAKIIHTIKGS